MLLKKKLLTYTTSIMAGLTLFLGIIILLPTGKVYAETIKCADETVKQVSESDSGRLNELCASNGGVKAGETAQSEAVPIGVDCTEPEPNSGNCEIIKYLLLFINGLSALVGVVIVGAITVGGIQYSAAGDNPQATMAAKKRIGNAILALLLYIFMFAFLQWIVPGGIF